MIAYRNYYHRKEKKKAQQVPEVFFKAKVGQDKFYFSNVKLKAPLVIGIKFSKKS